MRTLFEDEEEAHAVVMLRKIESVTSLSELPEFLSHEHLAVRRAAAKKREFLSKVYFPKVIISTEDFESG